jgi:hypothetical protein
LRRKIDEALQGQADFVVAGGDAPLLLQFEKLAFDAVAIPVAPIVRMFRRFAVRAGRDDRQNLAHDQVFAEPVAVITLSASSSLGLGNGKFMRSSAAV